MTEQELSTIGSAVACLTRHAYWNNELWRKRLKKYKKADKAEIQNAYLTARLRSVGVYSSPCGASWTCMWSEKYKDTCDEYLKEYDDLFDDYWNWQLEQR